MEGLISLLRKKPAQGNVEMISSPFYSCSMHCGLDADKGPYWKSE